MNKRPYEQTNIRTNKRTDERNTKNYIPPHTSYVGVITSLSESRGLIKFSNVRNFCFLKSTFIFGKSECASGVSVPCLVKANTEKRGISTVHRFYLYSQKSIPSCPEPEETVVDTKVLVFSLLRTFIVTPTFTLHLSTGNSDHFLFLFFFFLKEEEDAP